MATMTNAMTQAYRTTCIPKSNKIDTFSIPSDYVGQELEIIVIPLSKIQTEYNEETLAVHNNSALNRLCGMFKNTSLLSSDDFSKNKELEKKIEEEKFKHG
jgi:hypothetical protein